MRKLGLLLLVSAVACALHATARPVAAQSPLDPSLTSYSAEEQLSGKLTLSGSTTMSQVAAVWAESFRQHHPDAQIEVLVTGSVEAVNSVAANEAQIGLLSRTILQSEVAEFQSKHGHPPVVLTPMYESIGVFVHKDNPIKGLTFKDLDAIFSFTLKRRASKPTETWGDLGLKGEWASRPILVHGRRQATGVQVFFQEVVLGNGEFRPDMREVIDNSDMLKAIATNPNAIGFAGASYDNPNVKMVPLAIQEGQPFIAENSIEATRGLYPLVRPLQLVLNQDERKPLPPLQAEFVKYVFSRFGQEDVVRSGMHPINARAADLALDHVGLGHVK